jgi:hypothetical protein
VDSGRVSICRNGLWHAWVQRLERLAEEGMRLLVVGGEDEEVSVGGNVVDGPGRGCTL